MNSRPSDLESMIITTKSSVQTSIGGGYIFASVCVCLYITKIILQPMNRFVQNLMALKALQLTIIRPLLVILSSRYCVRHL